MDDPRGIPLRQPSSKPEREASRVVERYLRQRSPCCPDSILRTVLFGSDLFRPAGQVSALWDSGDLHRHRRHRHRRRAGKHLFYRGWGSRNVHSGGHRHSGDVGGRTHQGNRSVRTIARPRAADTVRRNHHHRTRVVQSGPYPDRPRDPVCALSRDRWIPWRDSAPDRARWRSRHHERISAVRQPGVVRKSDDDVRTSRRRRAGIHDLSDMAPLAQSACAAGAADRRRGGDPYRFQLHGHLAGAGAGSRLDLSIAAAGDVFAAVASERH